MSEDLKKEYLDLLRFNQERKEMTEKLTMNIKEAAA